MRFDSRMSGGLKSLREYLYWALLFLILSFVFLAIILIPTLLTVAGPQAVPYALHSVLFADYSVDPHAVKHSRLQLNVIAQVINDQKLIPSSNELGEGTRLNPGLDLPVPSVTPQLEVGTTPTPEVSEPNSTRRPTEALPSPTTSSKDPSATLPAKMTPTPTLQSTPDPGNTRQPSRTPVSNFPTRTPTLAHTPQPGDTKLPPTSTLPVGKPSQTPPPTSTPPPATQVPPSTSIAPTKTSAPTDKPPTPTSPPPTPVPIPPTRTPAPTQPPPTNTPRPTKTKDPYPPPPYP